LLAWLLFVPLLLFLGSRLFPQLVEGVIQAKLQCGIRHNLNQCHAQASVKAMYAVAPVDGTGCIPHPLVHLAVGTTRGSQYTVSIGKLTGYGGRLLAVITDMSLHCGRRQVSIISGSAPQAANENSQPTKSTLTAISDTSLPLSYGCKAA
jgi:hypothetical protein